MTPTKPHAAVPAPATPLRGSPWIPALAVGLTALAVFGWDLAAEPAFADESAYYSQSYYAAVFASGRRGDPLWLEYPAYDLPPLPKYLIGASLTGAGYPLPRPADARAWYLDTSRRFDPPGALRVARLPVVAIGALGCVAIYGLGVLAAGQRVGAAAAVLLLANPLYRLHARRAMSDVPCEAFLLLGLFLALRAGTRWLDGRDRHAGWLAAAGAGVCVGLSLLSKLSGLLGLMVVAAWAVLTLGARVPAARKVKILGAAALVAVAAAATFVALDPFLTAHPSSRPLPAGLAAVERMSIAARVRTMLELRFRVSTDQKAMFPHNAVNTPAEKVATAAVQGFGRFGPFGPPRSDSTRRFDARQDWGAVVWLPWVAAGAVWAGRRGRAQAEAGLAPAAWAVLAQFAVALAVVTAYLPMAWDRYLLSIQAPASLLAAGAAVALADRAFPGRGDVGR